MVNLIDNEAALTGIYQKTEERKEILKSFEELLVACKPSIQIEEKKQIRDAFLMAADAHKDMRRKSGEPYILHPLAVARIVAEEISLDATSIICALLHDVVEDTEVTLKEIAKAFNKEVANIVDGLTKISGLKSKQIRLQPDGNVAFEQGSIQAENYKKILLTIGEDIRVVLIKIADRLHNMRTMGSMPLEKQQRISYETMYLYSPIAHRFGLYQIKSELEDLSLKYTNRVVYKQIANKLAEKKQQREKYVKEFIGPIEKALKEEGFENFQIYGRPKTIHSILNKIQKKNVEFEEIYDLFAIRIIIDTHPGKPIYDFSDDDRKVEKTACWTAYSAITNLYRPNRDRLRDWIAYPKSNGYESLHTTVMGSDGKWVEVQIRTKRMHEIAEKGIAAHWKYKEGSSDEALDTSIQRIREALKDLAENNNDAVDFVNDFKHNLYENEVFVFTPKGDVKTFPYNSSVLDFAFSVHTDVGSTCIGAKLNGKLVPISTKLTSGDQVEIITSKKQKPSKDWLAFTKSSSARAKIKSALKEEKKRIAQDGKEMLKRKLRSFKIPFNQTVIEELKNYLKYPDSLDFLYNIAIKNVNLNILKELNFKGNKIVVQAAEITPKENKIDNTKLEEKVTKFNDFAILSDFPKDIMYSIASCCNPVRDDEVFGIITTHQGIKIHSMNCPNAPDMFAKHSHRIIKTKWREGQFAFMTGVKLTGIDDLVLVNKVTNIISQELNINICGISFDAVDGVFEGMIKVFVKNLEELNNLIERLKAVNGIYTVKRYTI